jgi:hypothetical protein
MAARQMTWAEAVLNGCGPRSCQWINVVDVVAFGMH